MSATVDCWKADGEGMSWTLLDDRAKSGMRRWAKGRASKEDAVRLRIEYDDGCIERLERRGTRWYRGEWDD